MADTDLIERATKTARKMQLDPKGLEAAKGVMRSGSGILIMGEAFNATMEAAIRAYLEAAPPPSPAPGVVEALREARELIAGPLVGAEWKRACHSFVATADAALASLSQPAKGEREGGGL